MLLLTLLQPLLQLAVSVRTVLCAAVCWRNETVCEGEATVPTESNERSVGLQCRLDETARPSEDR
jgi:hypothetical protein